MRPEMGDAVPGLAGGVMRDIGGQAPGLVTSGAVHSAEIEYALGNLDRNGVYAWAPEDYRVSTTLLHYFANFIKTGDPNGPGLPKWSGLQSNGAGGYLRVGTDSAMQEEWRGRRYRFLDRVTDYGAKPGLA
jgi:para-nitrobenzyl esterase